MEDEIDLLVDGALGEERREQLLERLEQEDADWKRCALGFLEAQAWKDAMATDCSSPAVGAESRPPRWRAPLAAMAAGVIGFVAAFPLAKSAEPAIAAAAPAPAPAPEVELVPVRIIEEGGFVPLSDESGHLYYQAKGDIPPEVLSALVQAGHEVTQVERTIDVPREGGEPFQLPFTETRIFFNYEL